MEAIRTEKRTVMQPISLKDCTKNAARGVTEDKVPSHIGRWFRLIKREIAAAAVTVSGIAATQSSVYASVQHDSTKTKALSITTLSDISMHGFFFTINATGVLTAKPPYRYEVTFSDGKKPYKKSDFVKKYETVSGFYTFKVAGIEEGTTGTMHVKVSGSSGKENAAGIAYVSYPGDECGKTVSLGIDATVSCAGFNADFYGLLTSTQGIKTYVTGALFFIFTPAVGKYSVAKVYNGQSVKVSDGRNNVALKLKQAYAERVVVTMKRD